MDKFSESESDSDSNPDSASYQSNQDNASAQRSATTGGATVGSDTGIYHFSLYVHIFLWQTFIFNKQIFIAVCNFFLVYLTWSCAHVIEI